MDKYIENEAKKLAAEKAEIVLNENKEQYQLEVLKQFQENDIRKEGVELSKSSPLISDTYNIKSIELCPYDFIPDLVLREPLYEETILDKNGYSLEHQEVNRRTGKRKFVWKETITRVLICNPTAIGKCQNIAVYLKGKGKPLFFPNGEITLEAFHRQTPFAVYRSNLNVSCVIFVNVRIKSF